MERKEFLMSNSWLYVLGLMIASSAITFVTQSVLISILCDILVLVGAYIIFKRDRFIDMKSSMIFITILTVVNIMVTLGTMSIDVSRQTMIALVVWSWFGSRSKIFLGFIMACVIYNSLQMLKIYQAIAASRYAGDLSAIFNLLISTPGGITVITTMLVSFGALVLAAYINR